MGLDWSRDAPTAPPRTLARVLVLPARGGGTTHPGDIHAPLARVADNCRFIWASVRTGNHRRNFFSLGEFRLLPICGR